MANSVGELFVNLGVKGSEKTLSAFTSVTGAIKDTATASLETKAAIVGALYAFEQLIKSSTEWGTSLKNFEALTGMSARTLQQWTYAAEQGGAKAGEMEQSFKSLQKTLGTLAFTPHDPMIDVFLAKMGIDPKKRFDPNYMATVMQKFADYTKNMNPVFTQKLAQSLGITEGVLTAGRRGFLNPSELAKAPVISERTEGTLDKERQEWDRTFAILRKDLAELVSSGVIKLLVHDLLVLTRALDGLIDLFHGKRKSASEIGEDFKKGFSGPGKSASDIWDDFKNGFSTPIAPPAQINETHHNNTTINNHIAPGTTQDQARQLQKATESGVNKAIGHKVHKTHRQIPTKKQGG